MKYDILYLQKLILFLSKTIYIIKMNNLMKKFCCISKAIYGNYYENIASVEVLDESTLEIMKIKLIPCEGIHANIEY